MSNGLVVSGLADKIQQGAAQGVLYVSVISAWEVGMLEAKGRIALPHGCLEWVEQALRAPGITLAPLPPEIAVESSRLPGAFPGDPADRVLIATARYLGAVLVTQDTRILSYAKHHALPVGVHPKFVGCHSRGSGNRSSL